MDRGPGVPPPPRHQLVAGSRGSSTGSLGAPPGADGSSEDLSALGKREKVKDKVKRYIAKLSFVEMSVMKATTKIDGPPKEKHTRRLVLESWSHPDTAPAEVVHALSRCNLVNNVTVSLKALSTVHELMQRGSPAVLPAVYGWLDHMSLVQNHWDRNGKNADYGLSEVCSPLVVAYARLLTAKARFHAEHRAFENNYSFDGEAGAGVGGGGPHPISAAALRGMLSVGRTCREALEHCSEILPTNPPLITIQWQRLVAHVGKLMAVESHLLHGAAVYVAAMLAPTPTAGGPGTSGLVVEDADALESEHAALRSAFERARRRPAIVSAFVEEGGDPALPSGWCGEDGSGGRGGFRFLELPATLPSFDTEEGRAAMSSMIASSFGPPSSHLPPLPTEEEDDDELLSPFDEYPSDDDVGGESPAPPLKIVDVPDLIDLGDFEDVSHPSTGAGPPAAHFVQEWPSPTPLAPAPPRPPLFAGYGGVSNTPVAPAHGASTTPVSISGKGPARGAKKEHLRTNSGDKVLDINASLAAFELTATRPQESPKMKLNAREPSVFADIAPAGINSTRPAAPPPVSMNAQRVARPLVNQFAPSPQPKPSPQPQPHVMQQQSAMSAPRAPWPVPMQAPQPAAKPQPTLPRWNSPPRDWVQWDAPAADAPSVQTPADTQIVHPLNDAPVQSDVGGLLGDLSQGSFDEIPISAIRFGKRVGTGAFGEVLKATYQGTDVAVKRLRLDPNQPQAADDFRRELRVLCGLRHRHVVQFLGACTTGPDLCLVMDFCGVGSLYGVLHNRRQSITAAHVMRWMADTARGMVYLHSRNIIHRDIKSGNLLLDDSGVIKVADFGLARAHGPTSNLLTLVGTYPYMAPELLDSQPYNSSVDVYSFGVVMWECLTRDEPFRGFSPMQIVATLLRGERPKLPAQPALPASYVSLLTQCWATEPERRPTFEVALERLLEIAHAMKAAESRG
jgi:sterile alpha motif and leucine zipper-containing kinase AZK